MSVSDFRVTRRLVVTGVPALVVTPLPESHRPSALRFEAIRNGARIGQQAMTFEWGLGGNVVVKTVAEFAVKLGPITAFSYRHAATERWGADGFAALETKTTQNGRVTTVTAVRETGRVAITTAGRMTVAPASALPFTHWNNKIASAPLFNPQDGKLLREQVSHTGRATVRRAGGGAVVANRVVFKGEAYVEDYYTAAGDWTGLIGRLADGSTMEYRLA